MRHDTGAAQHDALTDLSLDTRSLLKVAFFRRLQGHSTKCGINNGSDAFVLIILLYAVTSRIFKSCVWRLCCCDCHEHRPAKHWVSLTLSDVFGIESSLFLPLSDLFTPNVEQWQWDRWKKELIEVSNDFSPWGWNWNIYSIEAHKSPLIIVIFHCAFVVMGSKGGWGDHCGWRSIRLNVADITQTWEKWEILHVVAGTHSQPLKLRSYCAGCRIETNKEQFQCLSSQGEEWKKSDGWKRWEQEPLKWIIIGTCNFTKNKYFDAHSRIMSEVFTPKVYLTYRLGCGMHSVRSVYKASVCMFVQEVKSWRPASAAVLPQPVPNFVSFFGWISNSVVCCRKYPKSWLNVRFSNAKEKTGNENVVSSPDLARSTFVQDKLWWLGWWSGIGQWQDSPLFISACFMSERPHEIQLFRSFRLICKRLLCYF